MTSGTIASARAVGQMAGDIPIHPDHLHAAWLGQGFTAVDCILGPARVLLGH